MSLNFEVKVEDNSKIFLEAEQAAIEKALFAIGVNAVEGAVASISGENLAVDTGRLRASISFVTEQKESGQMTPQAGKSDNSKNPLQNSDLLRGKAEKNSVYVGTNVEYATVVHEGDGGSRIGRPFLRDGINNKLQDMREMTEAILKGEEP